MNLDPIDMVASWTIVGVLTGVGFGAVGAFMWWLVDQLGIDGWQFVVVAIALGLAGGFAAGIYAAIGNVRNENGAHPLHGAGTTPIA